MSIFVVYLRVVQMRVFQCIAEGYGPETYALPAEVFSEEDVAIGLAALTDVKHRGELHQSMNSEVTRVLAVFNYFIEIDRFSWKINGKSWILTIYQWFWGNLGFNLIQPPSYVQASSASLLQQQRAKLYRGTERPQA